MKRDADTLFTQRGVADVRVLQGKMGADIEQKKVNLRVMVGERYRDLLLAADSVANMREASARMQSLLAEVAEGCCEAENRMRRPVKPGRGSDSDEDPQKKTFPSAVQIKLLVDTPEQIWNALEHHNYLTASRLWQAANYINRALGQSGNGLENIPLQFPLVQRQWDSISHFRGKILEKAKEYLKDSALTDEDIAESLCAIMLLERITPRQILGIFLATRRQTILDALKEFSKNATSIPDLLLGLSHVIQSTLNHVARVFYPPSNTPSRLYTLIVSLSKPIADAQTGVTAPNSVYALYGEKTNMHIVYRHLPPSIQNHVPLFNMGGGGIGAMGVGGEAVTQAVESWLAEVVADVQGGVSAVLSHVKGGAQLAIVREALIKKLSDFEKTPSVGSGDDDGRLGAAAVPSSAPLTSDWNVLCVHLMQRQVSLWDLVFRPVFKDLSVTVIEKSFEKLSEQVDSVLVPLLNTSQRLDSEDSSVSSYIWTSTLKQHKPGATATAAAAAEATKMDLFCRVQTPSLGVLTDAFEQTLAAIRADVIPLVTPKFGSPDKKRRRSLSPVKVFFEKEEEAVERDVDWFTKSFQEQYLRAIEAYQARLSALLKTVSGGDDEDSMGKIMFLARAAKAIAIKVKQLSEPILLQEEAANTASSIVARLRQRGLRSNSATSSGLEASQASLMDVHMSAMKIWIGKMGAEFESRLADGLANEDWASGSKFVGVWEAISLFAKDESGQTQEDKLKLPVHVSSFIVQSLLGVVSELNRTNGFILEKPCLKLLLQELAHRIIAAYRQFLDTVLPELKVSDKAPIQMLFDYEFLVKVVDGCWAYDPDQTTDNVAAKETKVPALAVLALIRSLIDPIDLAIASMHLSANVNRFYSRSSVLLGSLLALNVKPLETKKNPSLQEMHNVIAVVNQPPRFTLLLTSLPGASLPAPRMRGTIPSVYTSQSESSNQRKRRTPRARIRISANSVANTQASSSNASSTGAGASYSISGSVISGVVGLVGAAASTAAQGAQMAGVSQQTLFGGASSMFGAFMGGGGTGGSNGASTGKVGLSSPPKKI
ncbi:hypothetical protein BC830DRAFT_1147014 [Chytriomyces sp. MP71]|nr:hypothetical protein BC830DRAFT_1147014 [Chytriomyces sp. MP71]